jgi:L-ascorbate peroxidase
MHATRSVKARPPPSQQQRPLAAGATAARRRAPPARRGGRPVATAAAAAATTPGGQSSSALPRSALLRRLLLLAPGAAAALLLLPSLPHPPTAQAADAPFPRALAPPELAALRRALAAAAPKPKAPVLLRLVFHDAGTFDAGAGDGGANASVRLELERPENGGLKRGWRVIEALRAELRKQEQAAAPGGGAAPLASVLSDADLIALAGAHAVEVTGGPGDLLPRIRVGRTDAAKPDPEGRLPSEKAGPAELVAAFAAKTLSAREMVALSGAHTLGSKGFGDPLTFDNAYYTTLLARPWEDPRTQMPEMIGLASDRALPGDARCRALVEAYASDPALFFGDFSDAYARLTELGARWR